MEGPCFGISSRRMWESVAGQDIQPYSRGHITLFDLIGLVGVGQTDNTIYKAPGRPLVKSAGS